MTNAIEHSPVNRVKVSQIEAALADMLSQALRRGFHGCARIELSVQDGTIQQFRRAIERIEK